MTTRPNPDQTSSTDPDQRRALLVLWSDGTFTFQASSTDPAPGLLTDDQRRNIEARRAEIVATLARCAADLNQISELENGATFPDPARP